MKILFLNLSGLKFNVATPDTEPMGGSESGVCHLARRLAQNGHEVTLIARLPDGFSGALMRVQHHPPGVIKDKDFFAAGNFDVIVACNAPLAAPHLRAVSPRSFLLLWNHMAPDQPGIQALGDSEAQQALDGVVYVSQWQKDVTEQAFGATKKSWIIGNGLAPAFENMFASPRELLQAKSLRAAYASAPYRGLGLLIKIMNGLPQDIELDVYSSMRIYQTQDDEFGDLFQAMKKNPHIHSHGARAQPELARCLKPAAFLTYPCLFAETYCNAALEAMAAGMKVISSRLGALATTTMGFADLMPVETQQGEKLVALFRAILTNNIAAFLTQPEAWAEKMFEQVQAVNRACAWAVRVKEWENLFAARRPR